MKTAMQEAIDKISFVRNMCDDDNNEMDLVHTLETLKKSFIELLEKEKEQIKKAFSDGQETPINHPTLPHYSREEYYNDNYNN